MTEQVTLPGAPPLEAPARRTSPRMRRFYDILFVIGFLSCLLIGPLNTYVAAISAVLLICAAASFFDDNFYLYTALFMYVRFLLVIGSSPAYRIYSYLVVIKFLFDLTKLKFRPVYFPAIFVFVLHSILAFGRLFNMRQGLEVVVDMVIIYIVISKVLGDHALLRKFLLAFLLGGVISGVFGWTADMSVSIKIAGAGSHEVNRRYGSLSDVNFAGLFYCSCFYISLFLKILPRWAKLAFAGFFLVTLLQTASLSAILTLLALGVVALVLKFKRRSIFVLLIAFTIGGLLLTFLLTIPQFREIPSIAGLIIRIDEKLGYLLRGRWDLLTTNRTVLWANVLDIFNRKPLFGKLFGGNVLTVMFKDLDTFADACHNSIIQSLLNFGIIGTLLIYLPFLGVLAVRVVQQLSAPDGDEDEDIRIVRILMPLAFFVFGMSVDFFIDWAYLFFFFI